MKSLILWSTLALGAIVPVGFGVLRNAGCGACDCCGCCQTGSCTCEACSCACCSDEGCPGRTSGASSDSACCRKQPRE